MPDDAVLVERARDGDEAAFAALYERYFDRVYDFLARMVRDQSEAADLTQDTFLKAMKSLASLSKGGSFKSWLFTIARNTALNRLERASRSQPLEGQDDDGDTYQFDVVDPDRFSDPELAAEATSMASIVWEAAKGLDPKSYSVLHLTVRDGLDSAEVADVLGITKNNAYVMVNRMKKALEEAVGALALLRLGRHECADLDGELTRLELAEMSPEVRRLIDRHSGGCAQCRERRAKLASPFAIFAGFGILQPAGGIKESIFANLQAGFSAGGSGGASGSEASVHTDADPGIDSSSTMSPMDAASYRESESVGPQNTPGFGAEVSNMPLADDVPSSRPVPASPAVPTGPDAGAYPPIVPMGAPLPDDEDEGGKKKKVLAALGLAAVLFLVGTITAVAFFTGDEPSGDNDQLAIIALSPTLSPTATSTPAATATIVPTPVNAENEPEPGLVPGGSTDPTAPPIAQATQAPSGPAGGGNPGGLVATAVPPAATATPVPPTATPTVAPSATPTATVPPTRTPTATATTCPAPSMSTDDSSLNFGSGTPETESFKLSVSGCGGALSFTTSFVPGYSVIPMTGNIAPGSSLTVTVERLTPGASDGTLIVNPSAGPNILITLNGPLP